MSEALTKSNEVETVREIYSIESYDGTAKITDIRPEHQSSSVPVIVAGGWSEGSWSLEQAAEEVSNGHNPRRVLLVDHARRGNVPNDIDYPRETSHRANTLISALDNLQIERADIIAHSEGALDAVLAAARNPERFRSLILVAPAGMMGDDSFLKLAGRFMPKQARTLTKDVAESPRTASRVTLGGAAYISKNPVKALREVSEVASTTIDNLLLDLRKAGIRVGLIQSHADRLFPAKRIEKQVILDEDVGNVDAYASVAAKDAGHDDLLIHPERSTRAAVQMIEQFERTP